jgi:hypothetical protein
MTAEECAAYMRFKNLRVFYRWLETNPDFPRGRRGKHILVFDRRIADAFLSGALRLQKQRGKSVVKFNVVNHAAESDRLQRT